MGKGMKELQGGMEEENIIEVDNKMAFIDKVGKDEFIKDWKVAGALQRPNVRNLLLVPSGGTRGLKAA
jgi:hypothetical protein